MARNFGDIGAIIPSASEGAVRGVQNMQNILGINDALNKRYADAETLRQMQFAAPNAPSEIQPFNLAGLNVPESQLKGGFIAADGTIQPREVIPESAPVAVAPAPAVADQRSVVMKPPEVAPKKDAQAGLDTSTAGGMTYSQFMKLSPAARQQHLANVNREQQAVRDRLDLLRVPAAFGDIATLGGPINAISNIGTWTANAVGIPRLGRALGIYEPDVTRVELPVVGERINGYGSATPYYDMVRKREATAGDFTMDQYVSKLQKEEGKAGLTERKAAPAVDKTSLFSAMQYTESRNPNAISPKGATGLMQVLPSTAMNPGYGIPNVFDFAYSQGVMVSGPRNEQTASELLKNPRIGQAYGQAIMSRMLEVYKDTDRALVAYNWGPGNADAWIKAGADPKKLPLETQNYLATVHSKMGGTSVAGNAPTRIAIGDSVAEGFAKANNLPGSYKTGASPQAVFKMLQDYASKNSLQGVDVYLGSGMPNNPAEKQFVEQQIKFVIEKGGRPVLFGVGPGSDKNPTTGQNEFLQGLAQQYQTQFSGSLGSMFPSIKKNDPMGLHPTAKQHQTLYTMLSTKQPGTVTAGVSETTPRLGNQAPAVAEAPKADAVHPVLAAADATRKDVLGPDLSKNPPTQAKFDVETKDLIAERDFLTQQAKATENSIKQGLNNEMARVQIDHQNASAEYNFIKSQYDAAMRTGNRPLALQLQPQLNQAAAKINTLQVSYNNAAKSANDQITQLNQALYGAMKNNEVALWASNARMAYSEFATMGDPRRMQAVWNQYSGGNKIDIQSRTDGKWNLSVNGVKSPTALDTNTLVNQFRETVEPQIRNLNAQTASARNSFLFQETTKANLDMQKELTKQLGEAQIKMIEGKLNIQKELVGFQKPTVLENGKAIVFPKDPAAGIAFLIDMNPESFGEDGVLKPSAIQPVRIGVQAGNQTAKK